MLAKIEKLFVPIDYTLLVSRIIYYYYYSIIFNFEINLKKFAEEKRKCRPRKFLFYCGF